MWPSVKRQGICGACGIRILAELTFLPMLILSHTDAFVANVGRNDGFLMECSKIYLCTNNSGIYTLVTGTQVLLDGKPTCDASVRNSISLAIQNYLNDACTSAHKTTNVTLNLANLPNLSNCTGTIASANLSFESYYNCTSTKPTAIVIVISSAASPTPTAYSSESTSHSESSLSNQTGGASTSRATMNADQSATEQDDRITVILASVIPILVIFGAVAVTLGVLARRSRIRFTAILNSLRRRKGSFEFASDLTLPRVSSDPGPESAYASLHELDAKPDDHIYADFVQRSLSSGSASGEAVYVNGPVHLPS